MITIIICNDRNYMDAATCPEIDHSIFSFLAAGVAVVWCFVRFLYFRTQPGGVYDTPLLLKQGWLWYSSRVLGSTPSLPIYVLGNPSKKVHNYFRIYGSGHVKHSLWPGNEAEDCLEMRLKIVREWGQSLPGNEAENCLEMRLKIAWK